MIVRNFHIGCSPDSPESGLRVSSAYLLERISPFLALVQASSLSDENILTQL